LQHEAASLQQETAKLSAFLHALRSKLLAVQKQNACLSISNQHTQGAIGALQGLLAARQQAQQQGGQVLPSVSTAQLLLDQQASQLQQFQQLQVHQSSSAIQAAQHARTDPVGLAKAASAAGAGGAGAAGFPKLPEGGFLQMLTTDDVPDTRQPTEAELSEVLNWLDEPL